jgi:hypothetical protein
METQNTQPKAIVDLESDAAGNWEAVIPQDLPPGLHKVIVETEDGQQQDLALFNMPMRTEVVDKPVQVKDYHFFLYPTAILTLLVLILALNNLRLMVKAKLNKRNLEEKQKRITLITVLASVLAISIFAFLAYQAGWMMNYTQTGKSIQDNNKKAENIEIPVELIDVRGLIVDPVTNLGLSGADLTVGDVNIRLQDGGAYVFSQIPANSFIRITHPQFKKPIKKSVILDDQGAMDVYLSADMINALITVIDYESTGQLQNIYQQLPEKLINSMTEEQYLKEYEKNFDRQDLSNQELVIKNIIKSDEVVLDKYSLLLNKAILVELTKSDEVFKYYLTNEDGSWSIVK